MIHISNLIHRYTVYGIRDEEKTLKTALNSINMDIAPGEFVVILGHNGSGKSTLAKHLNVLLQPDEGNVWIDGKDTKSVELLSEIRDQVGMVFQNPDNQIIGSIVEEDVAFGLENRGVESSIIRKRVNDSLTSVGLLSKRKTSPYHLSGGQKQRVAVAGVLSCLPRCIVLDEPTAMLDPHSREELLKIIHRINREKHVTVVLITHHMDEAVDADRIILMAEGNIIVEGTPNEIFSNIDLLYKCKMEIPQVTDLANRLRKQGLPFSNPVLSEEQFVSEFQKIYSDNKVEVTKCS